MKSLSIILLCTNLLFATQWQPPISCGALLNHQSSFNSINTMLYGDAWRDGYWAADICYYTWDGNNWVWAGWVQGDVNTTYNEIEPFLSYDGQHLYFERYYSNHDLYVADWNGSGFVNSRPLNSNINQGNSRDPSLTQDMQHLYFIKSYKIYVTDWNGSDWGVPVILPPEINNYNSVLFYTTISPDGNEIYFTNDSNTNRPLVFSKKIGGIWQQWQLCDYNINPPSPPNVKIWNPVLTYGTYSEQELYFSRNWNEIYTYHALRSPVSVEPASLGQIKANYAK
jgi:hypothetical protein